LPPMHPGGVIGRFEGWHSLRKKKIAGVKPSTFYLEPSHILRPINATKHAEGQLGGGLVKQYLYPSQPDNELLREPKADTGSRRSLVVKTGTNHGLNGYQNGPSAGGPKKRWKIGKTAYSLKRLETRPVVGEEAVIRLF